MALLQLLSGGGTFFGLTFPIAEIPRASMTDGAHALDNARISKAWAEQRR
jgi:hypothetical protein